nr:hypothetical protein [Microbacterium barkeri]
MAEPDDWVDPTGALDERSLSHLRSAFERVATAARLPAFDWEAQWFAGLLASGGELAPDYPASEATHLDWAFQVAPSSALASDEARAPGVTEYVAHLMGRAATLADQTTEMFREQYRENVTMHLGVETSFALTRMLLELIGRIRYIIVPEQQSMRVKAYVGSRHYDLRQVQEMTGTAQPESVNLEALASTLDALPGEPQVYRDTRRDGSALDRWHLNPGAAARHLASRSKGPDLYWRLSEAVHGGGLISQTWFAHGEAHGVELVRRCAEVLRFELTELNAAYVRYATYDMMNAG